MYNSILISFPLKYKTLLHFSLFMVSGLLAMIIIRTLRRDIANYNKEDELVRIFFNFLYFYLLICLSIILVSSLMEMFFISFRKRPWKRRVGSWFMVTYSALLDIPWSSLLSLDLVSKSFVWFWSPLVRIKLLKIKMCSKSNIFLQLNVLKIMFECAQTIWNQKKLVMDP